MANTVDIEKISELGKIDIPNLKLILRELLNDIKAEQDQSEDFKVDISTILKLLFEKGFITEDEYNELKDKINSMIDSDIVDDAFDDDISDETIEEIIKKSKFKGFFSTYEDLINKFPASKATHGDYAYIRDFNADNYDVNNIEEYIYDVSFRKWVSASDTTHLRNVYIREDEEETGRINGQPLDNDLIQYNEILKRWICKTYDEADIARKSSLDFHTGNKIELVKDEPGKEDGSIKDDGRLIIKLDTSVPNTEPMHLDKNNFKLLLEEIDRDYFTRLHVDVETDELGIEKLIITGDDEDEYGNAIRRNVTNKVMRKILKNIYDKLLSTFDIPIDPETNRLLEINEEEPNKYVPHGINTYNVDKIISAIDRDYNNAFKTSDKEENYYSDILNRVLENYKELNITDENVQEIAERLINLYGNKTLWDRYTKIPEYQKNKNLTPEVFNELIDLLHYLYISKDLIRDEILERDITINGQRTYTNNTTYTGNKNFTADFNKFQINNTESEFFVDSKKVNFGNTEGSFNVNHKEINIGNENSDIKLNANNIEVTNPNGTLIVNSSTDFNSNVIIKGNLDVKGTTTTINSENLTVEDNIIHINKGEQGAGVSHPASGILIDRGTEDSLFIGFDEMKDRLAVGTIKDESPESISTLKTIAVLEDDLDIRKPLVYNPKSQLLENSELLRTDIDGAVTFLVEVPNHDFKVLDPVTFIDNELRKCSIGSYEECEVIGIVSEIIEDTVKITVNGFIPCEIDVPNGTVLYLLGDYIGEKIEHLIIQRKVAIKVPNGIIVDIQKNSGTEDAEVRREQIMYRVLEPNTSVVYPDSDIQFDNSTKVFIDGVLQIENEHYSIDYHSNYLRILNPYEYKVDLMIIINLKWSTDNNDYVTNEEIDNIFNNTIDPRPPFEDTEYLQNYEVDRIFGIISSDGPGEPVHPSQADWCTDEEIDNIFTARVLYKKYNILEQSIPKDIFVEGNYIYYFSKEKYLEICDFIEIDYTGKFNKINYNSKNVIGIVQNVTEYENGIIEYQFNTSKIIPYSDISLQEYIKKYKVNINFGDNFYISDKVNKFSGIHLCSFSNVAMFIEFQKKNEDIKPDTEKFSTKQIFADKYYLIKTEKMSINTLDLFESDSPNFCKLNLINNISINEKNLYYDIQLGKQLFTMYRQDENFVIKPIRNLKCNTNLIFKEIKNENLIRI